MKNRKTVIVAFLLVAALLLGVGYAAVTNVLDIQGSVNVSQEAAEKEFNEDVYFEGVVVDGAPVQTVEAAANKGYTANINANNNDKAQFTVTSIQSTGDEQAITYRIKNESEHPVDVSLKTSTSTNDKFSISYYFETVGTTTTTIASNSTVDVTVVVSLDDQLDGADSSSFIIELNATSSNS